MGTSSYQPPLDDDDVVTPIPPSPILEGLPSVEVRRSARRRRTVSAHRDGDRTVVMIPARMSRAEEREWVEVMVRRLDAQDRRRRPSDTALMSRARRLSAEHLGGRARPASVRWVTNQSTRWGSCTPQDATIRLSDRLRGMPAWVVDYVLVHELAHLVEATHSPRFWALVSGYPRAERARGYLEGVAAAAGLGIAAPDADVDSDDPDSLGAADDCLGQEGRDGSSPLVDAVVGPSAAR